MTKKTLLFNVGLNVLCAVLWTVNFVIDWLEEGVVTISTGCFGVAALCFAVAAVTGGIRILRLKKEEQ